MVKPVIFRKYYEKKILEKYLFLPYPSSISNCMDRLLILFDWNCTTKQQMLRKLAKLDKWGRKIDKELDMFEIDEYIVNLYDSFSDSMRSSVDVELSRLKTFMYCEFDDKIRDLYFQLADKILEG